jgi:hypothetical protein
MNDLLTFAVKAHGGLDRWNQFTSVKANVSVGGALWHVKGKPDALKHIRVEAHLRDEQVTTHFVDQNKRLVFTPDRVAVENEAGEVLASRENPRSAFRDQVFETPWDDLQVAYFNSYALWTYLTIPFPIVMRASPSRNSRRGRRTVRRGGPSGSRFLRISRAIHGSRHRISAPMVYCGDTSTPSTSLEERMGLTTRTITANSRESRYRQPGESLRTTGTSTKCQRLCWWLLI